MKEAAERIAAAVAARKNPDFLIVARSDAFWVNRDLADCIARRRTYAEAGADLVFPTMVGAADLAEGRLCYAFSIVHQFDAMRRALATGRLASDTQPLENFLGYR